MKEPIPEIILQNIFHQQKHCDHNAKHTREVGEWEGEVVDEVGHWQGEDEGRRGEAQAKGAGAYADVNDDAD